MNSPSFSFFFFNDTATTEIYTLSLHDALPISAGTCDGSETRIFHRHIARHLFHPLLIRMTCDSGQAYPPAQERSEEHTSELQSQSNLVCRLLLEKKKNK